MQYKQLIDLLDQLIQSQSRVASAQRKNRPESSSPEKLKMRNLQKASGSGKSGGKTAGLDKDDDDEDEDDYSDEEIANDPDDGEDDTSKPQPAVKKQTVLDGDDDDDEQYLEEFEKI